jgi:hypothetical protein
MPATSTRSCAPFPPATTLLWALDLSEELATIPCLTTALIKNHLLHSTATDKGHMHQQQANTASTRNIQSDIITACAKVDCMFPPQEICAMQDVFCFAVLADAITGAMYTNITGAFPVRSFKSMQYVLLPTSTILLQSSSGPCHLAPMLPWYKSFHQSHLHTEI